MSEAADVRTSSFSNAEVQLLKSELDSERKSKLANGAQHYERSCAFMGEIQDRDEKLGIKNTEIIDMKRHIDELRRDLKSSETSMSRVNPNDLPFSAGLNHHDLASRLVIDRLENQVNEANSENNVLRSWVSQVDKELNHETNVALYYRGRSDPTSGPSSKQNKKINDLLREVDNKIADGTEKDYYQKPSGGGAPPDPDDDPFDPFGPNSQGPPPDPPGLPSVRGSQRDSMDDVSTAAYTAEEPPRVSRREADKVNVSPWPKQQNLGVWQSDLVKSVVLAANDGDRAAWEAWLQHATRPNPDLDLLNDSGGQRFQSIDAKLSIALSNVITQAGDAARHVSIKLRLRTQQHSRRGTYVMGREILAMILEHFRTPGQRETAFTMEHIVSMRYLGDQHLEVFYEKWMEVVSNMMPDDVPPDDWLRDALYKKIRNSNLMMFEIKQYESWMEGDQRRTYRYLLDIIERHISRIREDKHVAARVLLRRLMPILRRSPRRHRRRRQPPRRRPRLRRLLYCHHHNQSSMQKVKGKARENQRVEVQVQDPRRRFHVIFTLSRRHAARVRIVNLVMIRRYLTPIRIPKVEVVSRELQEVNLQRTRLRRTMSIAGTGHVENVVMETSATNGMTKLSSTQRRTSRQQLLRPHPLLSMIGTTMRRHSTKSHRTSSRRRSGSMNPRTAS